MSITAAALLALGGAACERDAMDDPGDMNDIEDMDDMEDGDEM